MNYGDDDSMHADTWQSEAQSDMMRDEIFARAERQAETQPERDWNEWNEDDEDFDAEQRDEEWYDRMLERQELSDFEGLSEWNSDMGGNFDEY